MSVARFPKPFKHPPVVSGEEYWNAPEPSDEMAWAACDYTRPPASGIDRCERCPSYEHHERFGQLKRGCRMMAEGACRNVLAAMEKHPPTRKGKT